ncbi:DUF4270 family protein [Zunongwangia pacifica]|uniref:DUF4270 domain-containing protein n=1 Tax=Zunongwangia pacifica TaxID=2911062 RepID=A0A9X2CPE7_9FLAO|nr:DUF4270 family protein [Zunongwangia pacifica]MCL6219929.1 DUF4270 domain-containing protein [Zunongwangia pacifica]
MKSVYFRCFGVLCFILCFSCSNDQESISVGEDWINSEVKVYTFDTLPIEASTIQFDSLIVNSEDNFLVGSYKDDIFGRTTASSFLKFTGQTFTIEDEAEFDSISLILNYDSYSFADTTHVQSLNIYRLAEEIETDENANLYRNSDFEIETASLSIFNYSPRPHQNDSIQINIAADLGQELFDKIQNDEISSNNDFNDFLLGLAIVPDSLKNTSIVSFSKENSYLRLYYSIKDEIENEDKFIDFSINASESFHQIKDNHQDTYFLGIEDQLDQIPSSQTNNQVFIQSGTGIVTRIEFPNFKQSLNDIQGSGSISNAILNFKIKVDRNNVNYGVKDSLPVYIINKRAEVQGHVYNYLGTQSYAQITQESDEFNTLEYSLSLKYFLDDLIADTQNDDQYLAIYSPNFNNSVDRYVIYGPDAAEDNRMKLQITYAIYNEDE